MVRIFSAVALFTAMASSVVALPVPSPLDLGSLSDLLGNSNSNSNSIDFSNLSSNFQNSLRSIGSRVSSNWRSNSGEVLIVQTVIESLIISQGRNSDSLVIQEQEIDIEQIIGQIGSFGIDVNENDFSNIFSQEISNRNEEEIIIEMLESVVEIVDVTQSQVTEEIQQSQLVSVVSL